MSVGRDCIPACVPGANAARQGRAGHSLLPPGAITPVFDPGTIYHYIYESDGEGTSGGVISKPGLMEYVSVDSTKCATHRNQHCLPSSSASASHDRSRN